jgi:hypothetical protein
VSRFVSEPRTPIGQHGERQLGADSDMITIREWRRQRTPPEPREEQLNGHLHSGLTS